MSRRTIRLVLGLAALLMALPVCAGKVYQWKDAKGVTHFSDEPPPAGQGYRDRDLKVDAPAADQAAARPAEDANCVTARRNLEQLKSEGPVGLDANGDGKPDKEMTAEERAQQVQQTERTIALHCSQAAAATP